MMYIWSWIGLGLLRIAGYYSFSWCVSIIAVANTMILCESQLHISSSYGTTALYGARFNGVSGADIIDNFGSSGSGIYYMNGSTDYAELHARVTATIPYVDYCSSASALITYLSGALLV